MLSTATLNGWYPGADRIGIPASNFAVNHAGRAAIVLHTMAGHMAGTIAYFTDPARRVSAHFAIDPAGHVKQFVSVDNAAYGNGLSWSDRNRCWIDPDGHLLKSPHPSPSWAGLRPPTNPNQTTISIELDGYPEDPIPAAMYDALIALLHWLSATFPVTLGSYTVGKNLVGHRDISPVSRPHCPGPRVDFVALAAAANEPRVAPGAGTYRVTFGTAVYEAPRGDAPIALGRTAVVLSSNIVEVDSVTNGFAHLASSSPTMADVGFVPVSTLERI